MKYSVQNLECKNVGEIDLPEDLFAREVRADILHRVVHWQLAKKRAGTQSTKNISEVSGTGRKPFRQKGTGNARQGYKRSALQRGGAIPLGPKPRSYDYALPKKVRKLGLKIALSAKHQAGDLILLDSLESVSFKTKEFAAILAKNGWDSVLFIDGNQVPENVSKATRNLVNVHVLPQQGANVYSILKSKKLVLTKDALLHLEARLK